MSCTNRGGRSGARRWSAWLLAVALAATLGPAVASAHDRSAAALQPEQIRMVQRALNERGYQTEPTGAWDDQTREALSGFQEANGLPRTGVLDPATSRVLGVNPQAVRPVSGTDMATWSTRDPVYNCEINDTIDCSPAGG